MQTLQHTYRGLTLVFDLNMDRILHVVTLVIALLAGAYIGSLIAL
ncbi:MAG: hypothetical protein AAFR45_05040 [Pseudomonadota bacterium]